jgi:hypothetical protein
MHTMTAELTARRWGGAQAAGSRGERTDAASPAGQPLTAADRPMVS